MVKGSKRTVDINGWALVRDNPLTKAGVYPYMGHEIPDPRAEPNKLYQVYRPAEELQDPETIKSAHLLPFIDEHEEIGKGATPAEKKGIQGIVGENVYYDDPYLRGNLRIYSDAANALINSKQKVELSAGYRCIYVWEPGIYNGQHYDCKQVKIRFNHLALVKEGRTGPDVLVQDHAIITIDTAEFVTMTLQEMLDALALLSEEDKAQLLAALQTPAEDADGELTDEQRTAAAAAAESLTATAETAEAGAAAAAAAVETGDPAAAAEAVAAAEATAATAEQAEGEAEAATLDALKKEVKALKAQQATMDTGALLRSISQRDNLAKNVSNFVGTFDHSAMTMDEVAQYGVKKLGIKCGKGSEAVALDAWMQGRTPAHQQTSSVTTDSARPNTDVKGKLWSDKK